MKLGLERNGLRFVAVCLVAAFVAACGSKINQSNFDKIENGMTREEVIDILGEAHRLEQSRHRRLLRRDGQLERR